MRDLARWLGAGQGQDLGDGARRQRFLAGRAGLVVQQALDALLGKALLPAPDRRAAGAGPPRHFQHRQALGRKQHDPGTLDVLERTRAVADEARQTRPGGFVKENTDSLSHPLRLAYLTAKVNPQHASLH